MKGGRVINTDPPLIFYTLCAPDNCGSSYQAQSAKWRFSGSAFIPGVGLDTNADLVVAFRVDQKTCVYINEKMGITNPGGNPPQLAGNQIVLAGFFERYLSDKYDRQDITCGSFW